MGENIFARKLREMEEGKTPEPFRHPPLEEGYKRVQLSGIETSTEKAWLIIIKETRKVWVPKSVSHLRYGNTSRGETEIDRNDVMDIETDFYEQTIG